MNDIGKGDSLLDLYGKTWNGFLSPREYIECPCNATAESYIKHYYTYRCKENVFDFDLSERSALYSKSSHTLSAFLMGMCFRSLVEDKVKERINERRSRANRYNFEYPWFLCCLYHDTYSQFEREYGIYELNSFESMRRTLGIEHEIHVPEKDVYKNWDWPLTYKRRTVEEYYRQRYNKGVVDHGIVSGVYCFDRLVKNYLDKRKGQNRDRFWTNGTYCSLRWDRKQIRVFAIAADAIIAHNIWHGEKWGIPELCPGDERERKLSITETPLAYYLSLIDTIEPVKWFTNNGHFSDLEILRNISIQLTDNIIRIIQTKDFFDFSLWFEKKMKDIPDWMEDTKAEVVSNKEIIIYLPHNNTEITE